MNKTKELLENPVSVHFNSRSLSTSNAFTDEFQEIGKLDKIKGGTGFFPFKALLKCKLTNARCPHSAPRKLRCL